MESSCEPRQFVLPWHSLSGFLLFFLKISSNMLSIFIWVMNWPESGPVI